MVTKKTNVKPDNPLSITDGAPRTIDVCGMPCRLPAAMDYRITARMDEACKLDDIDQAVSLLYCCLHANKTQIGQLWQAARDPKALFAKVQTWQAGVPADTLATAINELMGINDEGNEEPGDDEPENLGKKKTSAQ